METKKTLSIAFLIARLHFARTVIREAIYCDKDRRFNYDEFLTLEITSEVFRL